MTAGTIYLCHGFLWLIMREKLSEGVDMVVEIVEQFCVDGIGVVQRRIVLLYQIGLLPRYLRVK